MKKKMNLYVLFLLLSFNLSAQKKIMIQGLDIIASQTKSVFSLSKSDPAMNVIPSVCVNFFTNNKKFQVVDRQNLSLINNEKELQKSEDFIDGYIVDQGKSEGADYVLKALYVQQEKSLNIKIYDVATSTVKCSQNRFLELSFFGNKNYEAIVTSMLHNMMYDCFDIKYSLVRPIETKKDEVKTVLVAVGKKNKAVKGDKIQFITFQSEEVDGEQVQRMVVVGQGIIQEIQDENFSVVLVKEGKKEINTFYNESKKVYCLFKNSF